MLRHWLVLVLFAFTPGCDKSVVSASGGGGGCGGGGNSSQCPILAPNDGDTCDVPGLVCSFWFLSGFPTMGCSDGTWKTLRCHYNYSNSCMTCAGDDSCRCGGVCVEVG